MSRSQRGSMLMIPVPATDDRWTLEEETLPESALHDLVIDLLVHVLRAWVERTRRDAMVGRNLAVRWDEEHANRGVDPDVCLVEPAPPEGEALTSVCLWQKGHSPPRVAVEVVSKNTAKKDYEDGPARHAASGARELWIFDPMLFGPERPCVLQLWRRTAKGSFKRVYAGAGPAFSRELGAWVVVTDEGMRLRIADDAAGEKRWLTRAELEAREAERERAEKERERAEKERERARREAVEAEVASLRALLAKGGRTANEKKPRGSKR